MINTQRAGRSSAIIDPAKDFFIAQDQKPIGLGDVDLTNLSPLLRSLLVIDGTVTTFLEAYVMESIEVGVINQECHALAEDHEWLNAATGTPAVHRRVMLLGRDTNRMYAYAESLIVRDRLSSSIQQGLEQEPGGLGRILVDSKLESRREGLWYGREQLVDLPGPVHKRCYGDFLTRTYRLIVGGAPLMMITERFPIPVGTHSVESVPTIR
jgi:chorismate-pyruvate lyase